MLKIYYQTKSNYQKTMNHLTTIMELKSEEINGISGGMSLSRFFLYASSSYFLGAALKHITNYFEYNLEPLIEILLIITITTVPATILLDCLKYST